ncbi:MAG TPA: alpha-galactosidase, partial [Vicinamibacteria bacterium]|nr:alpha-galactosidase [Vicinamibacteria bacterium]
WTAAVPASRDTYLALFNARDRPTQEGAAAPPAGLPVPVRLSELGISGPTLVRDLWRRADLESVTGEFAPTIPWHGAGLYRISPPR